MKLFPLVLSNALSMAAMTAFLAVIGPIVRSLGLAEWHAGLTVSAAGIVWMLAARPWGTASERYGRRAALVTGLAGVGLSYLLLAAFVAHALAQPPAIWVSLLSLVALRCALGGSFAAIAPATTAWVADQAPQAQRAAGMAQLGLGNALGMVLGPMAASTLTPWGLAIPLFGSAILPWLAMAVAWRSIVPSIPVIRSSAPRSTLSDRRIRLPLLAAFLATYSVVSAQLILGFFVLDRLALAPTAGAQATGWTLAAVGVSLIAAQVAVATLKAVPPVRWLCVGALLSAGGFVAAGATHTLPMLMLACAIAGAGMGMVFPAFQSLAADAVNPGEQGVTAGSISAAQGLGTVVAPLSATLIYGLHPSAPFFCLGLVLGLLALVAVRGMPAKPIGART